MAARNTAVRDRHRRIIRGRREPCALCHAPIDYTLRSPHPESFEVDHKVSLHAGGPDTIDNKQPAHRRCNRAKSSGTGLPVPVPAVATRRRWWLEGVGGDPRQNGHAPA